MKVFGSEDARSADERRTTRDEGNDEKLEEMHENGENRVEKRWKLRSRWQKIHSNQQEDVESKGAFDRVSVTVNLTETYDLLLIYCYWEKRKELKMVERWRSTKLTGGRPGWRPITSRREAVTAPEY